MYTVGPKSSLFQEQNPKNKTHFVRRWIGDFYELFRGKMITKYERKARFLSAG
jgi:hypothetical protein